VATPKLSKLSLLLASFLQWAVDILLIPHCIHSIASDLSLMRESLQTIAKLAIEFSYKVPKSGSPNSFFTQAPSPYTTSHINPNSLISPPSPDLADVQLFNQSDEELAELESLELKRTLEGGDPSLDEDLLTSPGFTPNV
jgi:hypothetical protein